MRHETVNTGVSTCVVYKLRGEGEKKGVLVARGFVGYLESVDVKVGRRVVANFLRQCRNFDSRANLGYSRVASRSDLPCSHMFLLKNGAL